MTLTYTEYDADRVVEFTVSGHLSRQEYDDVIEPMQAFIDRHGTVRMIEIVTSFPTFDPSILLPGLKFDIRNLRHISRVAVVSDIGWFSPLVKAAGALVSTRMRLFPLDEVDEARAWVREPDS